MNRSRQLTVAPGGKRHTVLFDGELEEAYRQYRREHPKGKGGVALRAIIRKGLGMTE